MDGDRQRLQHRTADSLSASRRNFLSWTTVVGAAVPPRQWSPGNSRQRTSAVDSARESSGCRPQQSPQRHGRVADLRIPGLAPYVTANEDFYRIDTALQVPVMDPTE